METENISVFSPAIIESERLQQTFGIEIHTYIHTYIQHYLVRLIHRILTSVDKNCKSEVNAVICMFIDWKQAYSRQCHTLGVKSFMKNGVRPALIPLLIGSFEDRQMKVKWHGKFSKSRNLPGSGAMGANLGNWEFLNPT